MLETTTITSKGQVTIPAHIRETLALEAGDKMRFLIDDNGALVAFPIRGKIKDAYGILPKPAKALSLEDMKQAAEEGSSERAMGDARD